ncbi:hypothetical protein QTP88_026403 [Uroleucon formosanum]
MSELHKRLVCLCGKQKSNLNDTNSKRHISACKIVVERHQHQEKKKKAHNVDRTSNTNFISVHIAEAEGIANLELPSLEVYEYADVIQEVLKGDVAVLEVPVSIDYASNNNVMNETNISSEDHTTYFRQDCMTPFNLFNNVNTTNETVNDYGHISNDPVSFCRSRPFSHEVIEYLIKKGPFQPGLQNVNCEFPKDNSGRSCHALWYWKDVPGCAPVKRQSLSYSIIENKIFCHPSISSIVNHECTDAHIKATSKLKLKSISLPLIPAIQEQKKKKEEVASNKEVVKDLIDITIILASNGLAFRGHREGWKSRNRGNFLSLVDLFSKRSPCMAAYTSKLQNSSKKSHVSFISKLRQNQLIDSVAESILTVIQTDVKYARFFSISIDSTFDASRKEQVAFVIRYHLIAVKESSNTSGSELFTLFQLVCSERNLDWKNYLIGQSYDGAPNNGGQFEGLRSHVLKVNSSALYVWCHAHRLNLVLSCAVGCCKDAMDVFGNLESVFTFLTAGKCKVECYERQYKQLYPKQQMRWLKRAATTRWMSFSVALVTVLDTFEAVVAALDEIQSKEGPNDKKIRHLAGCLNDYLLSERFLLIAHLNQILQKSDLDLLAAANCIEETRESIRKLRCDTVFMDIIEEMEYFESSSSFCFTKLKKFCIRRKKLMPDIIDQSFETYFSKESLEVYKDLSLFSRKRLKEIYNSFINQHELIKEYLHFSKVYFNIESTSNLPKTFHENHLESIDSQDNCDSEDLENIEDENSKEKNNLSSITTVKGKKVYRSFLKYRPTKIDSGKIFVFSEKEDLCWLKFEHIKGIVKHPQLQRRGDMKFMVDYYEL